MLLMQPDVQLFELTAAGLEEPNAHWTEQGLANVRTAIRANLDRRDMRIVPYREPADDAERLRRHTQLLKLHEAVGSTLLVHGVNSALALPTKRDDFDYTLGQDAQVLREEFGADYALFTVLHDSYASGGRVVMMVAAAALGVGLQGGVQRGFASLVDLRTGAIVAFNFLASSTGDLRAPEPAQSAIDSLLGELPL